MWALGAVAATGVSVIIIGELLVTKRELATERTQNRTIQANNRKFYADELRNIHTQASLNCVAEKQLAEKHADQRVMVSEQCTMAANQRTIEADQRTIEADQRAMAAEEQLRYELNSFTEAEVSALSKQSLTEYTQLCTKYGISPECIHSSTQVPSGDNQISPQTPGTHDATLLIM
jgi:hypothetical protein